MALPARYAAAICSLFFFACSSDNGTSIPDDVRGEMRSFVIGLSDYARSNDPDFIVIPQNGHELVTMNGEHDGQPAQDYLDAIDGGGQEDFNYGYDGDGVPTPDDEKAWLKGFLDILESNSKQVLVIDYCADWNSLTASQEIDNSYAWNESNNYITFATTDRELSSIPAYPAAPYEGDNENIASLAYAKNFLYLLNSVDYASNAAYLAALQGTGHDLLIIDLYYEDGVTALSSLDVASLKTKSGGGTRLVLAYMSIGEAEDYRYYWRDSWRPGHPSWLDRENPDWKGNYKVHFWDSDWQSIIFGNDGSYLKKILDAGFDGVYLDLIDAYEYYE